MTIKEIKIKNYKSIGDWQTIPWTKGIMTFVGKNGSGKSNFLEALNAVFLVNSNDRNHSHYDGRTKFDYRIIIELTKDELKKLDAELPYTKENYAIEAYSIDGKYDFKINRIKSKPLVSAIKKNATILLELSNQLSDKLEQYNDLVDKLCINDKTGNLLCIEVTTLSNSTNYSYHVDGIKNDIKRKIAELEKFIAERTVGDDVLEISTIYNHQTHFYPLGDLSFELKYIPPKLIGFESSYITIDHEKIKNEIDRVNQETKDLVSDINSLLEQIVELTKDTNAIIEQEWDRQGTESDKVIEIQNQVRNMISRRCFFLPNENSSLIFSKEQNHNRYYSNINEQLILETYIREYIKGKNNEEMLASLKAGKLQHADMQEIAVGLEKLLNSDIPKFDNGMYSSVKVEMNSDKPTLILVEKSGHEVDFNSTSTGRRWYFTYYFIKKCLRQGDIFIIDEPAMSLHPEAINEVLNELESLAFKKNVSVIISTHSPYMISGRIDSFLSVKMSKAGSTVKEVSISEIADLRHGLGFLDFNSIILEANKKYIFVEGPKDVAAIKAFMRVFGVNPVPYTIFHMKGYKNGLSLGAFVIENDLNFEFLLDADTKEAKDNDKKTLEKIIKSLKKSNRKPIFAGEDTATKDIEGLFSDEDKEKYIKAKKVCPEKIGAAERESDFTKTTIDNFRKLFDQLGILSKKAGAK